MISTFAFNSFTFDSVVGWKENHWVFVAKSDWCFRDAVANYCIEILIMGMTKNNSDIIFTIEFVASGEDRCNDGSVWIGETDSIRSGLD